MSSDLHDRLRQLESEVASLRAELDATTERTSSRRHLLRAAAAGAVGVVGGVAALGARPAAAATGGAVLLGEANTADAVTSIENNGPFTNLSGPAPVALELRSPGGHLRFVGAPGDTLLGSYADGTLAYNGTEGLWLHQNSDSVRVGAAGFGPLFLLPEPIRFYDSRTPHIGGLDRNGPIASGTSRFLNIETGNDDQPLELPVSAVRALMLNLTIVDTVGSGYLALANPGQSGPPKTSNINWSATGQILANLAFTATFEGNFSVFAGGGGSTNVVIDLLGFVG